MGKRKTVLAILILSLGLVSVQRFGGHPSNVLGAKIAAGKQLQIDWFKPSISPSLTPGSSLGPRVSASLTTALPSTTTSSPAGFEPNTPCSATTPYSQAFSPTNPSRPCTCEDWGVHCVGGLCVDGFVCDPPGSFGWCSGSDGNGHITIIQPNGYYCIAKPVIYLYPKGKTLVDVKVTMDNGKVMISDPPYDEIFKGWDNVIADSDGTLSYQNHQYHELFYESSASEVKAPKTGIVIPIAELKSQLLEITTKLGLKRSEQEEFLTYWLPELDSLNSPYIQFSLIDPVQKQHIDNVSISPKPDTFIYILAYFKPLQSLIYIKPLELPVTPPERTGFTVVEWGGTIERLH